MYYDLTKTLSHNKLFNFVVGMRSMGKTYSFKKWAISSYLKTGAQFVYIRRFNTDLNKIGQFFDDIKLEYPEQTFKICEGKFYIDKNVAGYYLALSKHQSYKSTPYPLVDKICFDEFILEKGYQRYLPDEVNSFISLYSTISRNRDVTALLMSNAVTFTNPYFNYFNLQMPYGKEFYIQGDVLLQIVDNKEFQNESSNTRFANIIKGTKYYDYAVNNNFLLDNNSFIGNKKHTARFSFAIAYRNKIYGVWNDISNGYICISNDYDKSTKMIYSVDLLDHNPSTMFIKSLKTSIIFKTVLDAFQEGCLIFEDINIKNNIYDLIKKLY